MYQVAELLPITFCEPAVSEFQTLLMVRAVRGQTMESTVYGHPTQPKSGPEKSSPSLLSPAQTSA